MEVYGNQHKDSDLVVFTDHTNSQKSVTDFWQYTLESGQDNTFILGDGACVDVFYMDGSDHVKYVVVLLHNPIWGMGFIDVMVLNAGEYHSWLSSIESLIDYD